MSINWLVLAPADQDFRIPTYGNYGGPDYTGGVLLEPGETASFAVKPVDPLDALFRRHDRAVLAADTPLEQAQADLKLIKGIMGLAPNAVTGEGDLYAGAAILAMIGRIVVDDRRPDVLAKIDLPKTIETAAKLIEQGSLQPEPQERAALVAWLQQTSAALAESESPIADLAAEKILALVGKLGGGTLSFILSDDAFVLPTGNAAKALFVEAIVHVVETEGTGVSIPSHHGDVASHLFDALEHKLDSHSGHWDFAF
ncbi:hypothetical protein [Microvirga solisilvae]|uniref:hypothetical protein n=1 Tax=Microvirga solisilvae TaxID=2919498 RepID=UPI001FAE9982|nr:hypothetical protein [Microvirga solisilvae]